MATVFENLNSVNVGDHIEKRENLSFLPWAWAWAEVKKRYPSATYTIYENKDGWNYHTDGRTCWVKTGVTIEGLEHIEDLPVMDYRNKSIPLDKVTSFDVNKAIQRSLTKACARHGLGLYVYAGEDLPEGEQAPAQTPAPAPEAAPALTEEPKRAQENSRDILIKTLIIMAKNANKENSVNQAGFLRKGKRIDWSEASDDTLVQIQAWLKSFKKNKEAGAA